MEQAGLIRIEKTIQSKRTLTMVALADSGRSALDAYWRAMAALRERAGQVAAARASQATQAPGRLPLPLPEPAAG